MGNKEILEKAIKKAIEGGWKGVRSADYGDGAPFYYPCEELLKWAWDDIQGLFHDGVYEDYESVNVEAIIFSHDFAKVLWGCELIQPFYELYILEEPYRIPAWQFHLQQMVIAEYPIKYLGENL